jgi:hypothetical protein
MSLPLPIPEFKPADPVPFTETIEWFRLQAPWISGSSWNTMASLAALKADQVSGATLLTMLDDVWAQMDRAVAEGKPYSEFVRDVAKGLDTKWYKADSQRLRLIYHNNVGSALMAGREAQMSDPAVLAVRPYVMFDGIGDWRQTIEICKPRDGVILPADDPWWKANSPLLHHGCRSGKITMDEEDAQAFGGITPQNKLMTMAPAAKGWGKPASWTDWKPDPASYHPALFAEWQAWTNGQAYARTRDQWLANLTDSLKRGDILPVDTPRISVQPQKRTTPAQPIADTISRMLYSWVHGSKRKQSVTMKRAAIAEFGLSGTAYSRVQWNIEQQDVDAMRPALRRLYSDSQKALKDMHPGGTVRLYRGIKEGYAVLGALESWTTDRETAVRFDGGRNGDVLVLDVPIEHVLTFSGGPYWANGKFGEQFEYVLLSSYMETQK